MNYAKWFGAETGEPYRVPTEAEWEYAARAGSETRWCFGDDETDLDDHASYINNSNAQTQWVGSKRANAWGLYDMYGNVLPPGCELKKAE